MFELFKKPALTRKQRFNKAIIVGVATSILCAILKIFIALFFGFNLSILYLAIGVAIGMAIQRFGKGVQIQFSILAAALTLTVIIICDAVTLGVDGIKYMVTSLYDIAMRIGAVYAAFYFARIL